MKTNKTTGVTAKQMGYNHNVLVEQNRLYLNISNFNTGNVLTDEDRKLTEQIDNLLASLKMLNEVE